MFIYYQKSRNKNICQGIHKFGIIGTNEKFVAFGTVVKILATLKSPSAKAYYLIQKLEYPIGRVYFSQYFGNNFFLS